MQTTLMVTSFSHALGDSFNTRARRVRGVSNFLDSYDMGSAAAEQPWSIRVLSFAVPMGVGDYWVGGRKGGKA